MIDFTLSAKICRGKAVLFHINLFQSQDETLLTLKASDDDLRNQQLNIDKRGPKKWSPELQLFTANHAL